MKIIGAGSAYGTKFFDDNGNDIGKSLNVTKMTIRADAQDGEIRCTLETLAPNFQFLIDDKNIKIQPKRTGPLWGRITTHYA